MIHQPLSPDSLSQNQFVTDIVSPLPCPSGLVRHILLFSLFIYFFKDFKELISSIGFIDKDNTSVFNALISLDTV